MKVILLQLQVLEKEKVSTNIEQDPSFYHYDGLLDIQKAKAHLSIGDFMFPAHLPLQSKEICKNRIFRMLIPFSL